MGTVALHRRRFRHCQPTSPPPDEGYGFSRPENQIAFRDVTEAFLAKHLGGAAELIARARDFKGSTLTVDAGGELVPGLVG